MNKLLEILGRGLNVSTSELIWHWLKRVSEKTRANGGCFDADIDHAIELMGQQKTQQAEELLRQYLFDNNDSIEGRMAAASICLYKNDIKSAVEELNSVYMRQPHNTMALYSLGYCYEILGQEQQAVEFYQDCLKFKNYLELPRERMAAIYFKNMRLDKVISEYEELAKEYPDDVCTLSTLGYLYILKKDHERGAEYFNKAILSHPDNFHNSNEQIDECIEKGMYDEAMEMIEGVLEKMPDSAELVVRQGDILNAVNCRDEALERYKLAAEMSPNFLEATIKLGTQYLQMQENKKAAEMFNRGVEINDQIVDCYIGLSLANKLAGRSKEAMETVSLAAAIEPNSALLFAQTATLILRDCLENSYCDVIDDGFDMMEGVINAHLMELGENGEDGDLHFRIGQLLMSVSRMEDACEYFKNALEINEQYLRAKNKYIISLYNCGKNDEVLENLCEPDFIDNETVGLHYKVGLLYCNKAKFASTVLNLENKMSEGMTELNVSRQLSVVLQNLGLLNRVSNMWEALSETLAHTLKQN